jgi:hypothetical protein
MRTVFAYSRVSGIFHRNQTYMSYGNSLPPLKCFENNLDRLLYSGSASLESLKTGDPHDLFGSSIHCLTNRYVRELGLRNTSGSCTLRIRFSCFGVVVSRAARLGNQVSGTIGNLALWTAHFAEEISHTRQRKLVGPDVRDFMREVLFKSLRISKMHHFLMR